MICGNHHNLLFALPVSDQDLSLSLDMKKEVEEKETNWTPTYKQSRLRMQRRKNLKQVISSELNMHGVCSKKYIVCRIF